ncbi:PREDICTED: uncharacterized protein K02A2.6-like, partial [Vollenhovia emeryi]|uniref:uncharacterized protein K02A2.6-like n=1 Tax=Vollenhovia emeryi TaxID=411798 RepID=UPI0005F4B4C8
MNYVSEVLQTLNAVEIAKETKRDKVLNKIVRYAIDQWPKVNELSEYEQKFHAKREELFVEKGCLFWGYRIVIPESVKSLVLRELHASHFGTVRMKMIARSYVWWPGIDGEIEQITASCLACGQEQKKPSSVPLTPWPWPDKFWSRIHSDFLGPFHGHMFMIVIDAHAKWSEVIDMRKCTTSTEVIKVFRKLFARFGLPRHLVTDNGRQYSSLEFKEFTKCNGIKHSFSAPHHPATNGAAENFVQTFKDKVTKIMKSGRNLEEAIDIFLFDYRATEHCTTGRSPAYLAYKHELRTRFDLLRPDVGETVDKKQTAQIIGKRGKRKVDFRVGVG